MTAYATRPREPVRLRGRDVDHVVCTLHDGQPMERGRRPVAEHLATTHPLRVRAARQAARELLLAQSSDWAFIITQGTSVPYAVKRVREHLHRFHELAAAVEEDRVEPRQVAALRDRDAIFPWLDYRVYAA